MTKATAAEAKTAQPTPIKAVESPANGSAGPQARLKWNTTGLTSSYANFCNANSTREEVVLNFGVNKSWERGPKQELEIDLNHRIVLSPFAAKRLSQLMQQLIKEYEQRYGALSE